MGRRRILFVAVLLALVLAGVLAWTVGPLAGPRAGEESAAGRGGEEAPQALDRELTERAKDQALRLRGLPGVLLAPRGSGAVKGVVKALVPSVGEKPLPGAELALVASESGQETRIEGTSGEDGSFSLAPVPARVGYVLRARQPPYKDQFVPAIAVSDGVATDVGTIVFGAATTLDGRVTDAAGRPLSGALIAVERDGGKTAALDLARILRDLVLSTGPLAEARTDADGRFTLKGLPPGRYLVRATHPGHASASVSGVVVTADGDSSDVRVVLDPGSGFEGRVSDASNAPIEGARIVAVEFQPEGRHAPDRQETKTDAEGRWRLDTLPAGSQWFVEAHAEGFAPNGTLLRTAAERLVPADFTLTKGGRIEGRVFDVRTGAPVPSADILVVTGMIGAGTAPVATVAGGDGRYALENVIPGPVLLVEVRATGWSPGGGGYDAKAPREVKAGETLTLDVPLGVGGRVLGSVAGADGRPIAWASVVARRGDRWSGEIQTLSDARGAYSLPGLKPGPWTLVVTAAGWASPTADEDVRVTVEDGKDVLRDFTLSAGAAVSGTVASPDGQGVQGARVAVVAADSRRFGPRVRDLVAVTDAAGLYRVVGAPAGIDLLVEAEHDLWVGARSPPFQVVLGSEKRVDVTMRPGAKILGRASDAAGRPVRGARVRFGALSAEDKGRASDSFRADALLSDRVFVADDGGAFACDRARPGPVLLKVEADGYAPWYRRDLVVPDSGDLVGVTATLDGVGVVKGRVASSDGGRGIRGAWVVAQTREAPGEAKDEGRVRTLVTAETAADGSYVLERVPPGFVDVVVWFAAGHVTAWNDPTCRRDAVVAGATGVDFRLVPIPPPDPGGR